MSHNDGADEIIQMGYIRQTKQDGLKVLVCKDRMHWTGKKEGK